MRRILVSRAGRGAARRARPRDAGAGPGAADPAAAHAVERGDVRRFATRRSTSSTSTTRARRAGWSTGSAASGHFRVVGQSASLELANEALLRGDATLVLTIPHDFEASLVRTGAAPVQLDVNAEKGSAAGIVQAYASRIIARVRARAERGAAARPRRSRRRRPPSAARRGSTSRVRSWYNPTLELPALHGAGHPRRAGDDDRHAAHRAEHRAREGARHARAAQRHADHAAASSSPRSCCRSGCSGCSISRSACWSAVLVFGVPMRGSLVLLFGAAAVYLVVALAIGLWISTLVETQQQAMFVTFFILNVYLLMSGLFTPIDSMPPWVQVVSQLNPVRHFVTISRGDPDQGRRAGGDRAAAADSRRLRRGDADARGPAVFQARHLR